MPRLDRTLGWLIAIAAAAYAFGWVWRYAATVRRLDLVPSVAAGVVAAALSAVLAERIWYGISLLVLRSRSGHAFISYAHGAKDTGYPKRLAKDLRRSGIRVWLDHENVRAGAPVEETIRHNLERSRALVVVMTPEAQASSFVSLEISVGEELGLPRTPILREGPVFPHFQPLAFDDCRRGQLPSRATKDWLRKVVNAAPGEVIPALGTPRPTRGRGRLRITLVVLLLLIIAVGAGYAYGVVHPVDATWIQECSFCPGRQ